MATQITTAVSTSGNAVQLPETILDVYSQEIRFKAQAVHRFPSVARQKTELGVASGLTIKMLKYNALTGGYTLTDEMTAIETEALSASFVDITVGERAKAVGFSELALRSSYTNLLDDASTMLGHHLALNEDREARDTLLGLATTILPSGAATRDVLTTTHVFNVALVRDIVETMAVNKVPKFDGDAYVCFIHPHQAKTLRNDNAWTNIQNYAKPTAFFSGEIGRIENVRFVETTMVRRISKTDGSYYTDGVDDGTNAALYSTGADVYQAIVVGDYALGKAVSLPIELRDNGVEDFGRIRKLGYYGIHGYGLLDDSHGAIVETA